MKFTIPSNSASDSSGTYFANFSQDLSVQFGENSEFFVQWRQRFSDTFVNTFFAGNSGIKQAIITTGDQRRSDGSIKQYASCEAIGNVVTSYYQQRFSTIYNSCTGSGSHPAYAGLYESLGGGDYGLQNAMPAPYCTYFAGETTTAPAFPTGCFGWYPNEWMTFQIGITLGPRDNVNNEFTNSRVRMWIAREGQPSVLVLDWKPGIRGYFPLTAGPLSQDQKFGKIYLLPYQTTKDATQSHPTAYTWYDELIISRNQIADPQPGSTSPIMPKTITTPTPSLSQTTLSSPTPGVPNPQLSALGANSATELGPYRCTDVIGEWPGKCTFAVGVDNGMVYDEKRNRIVAFGGGHASTNYDSVNTLDMSTLTWKEEYLATPCTSMTFANYDFNLGAWLSGPSGPYPRAAARHTLDEMAVVGDELIVLAKVEGNGSCVETNSAQIPSHELDTVAKVSHYNFLTKTWSFADTRGAVNFAAVEYDPVSNKVILLGWGGLEVYDPIARTKTMAIDLGYVYGVKDEQGNIVSATEISYNRSLIYYPPNQKMYYFGLTHVFEINLDRGDFSKSTITQLTTPGIPSSLARNSNGFAYDSVNKIIGGSVYQNAFYAFDPLTKSWTAKSIQGGNPGNQDGMAITYDPLNNVFVFVTADKKTWAYRYATGM